MEKAAHLLRACSRGSVDCIVPPRISADNCVGAHTYPSGTKRMGVVQVHFAIAQDAGAWVCEETQPGQCHAIANRHLQHPAAGQQRRWRAGTGERTLGGLVCRIWDKIICLKAASAIVKRCGSIGT